jgi:hypothetical protein
VFLTFQFEHCVTVLVYKGCFSGDGVVSIEVTESEVANAIENGGSVSYDLVNYNTTTCTNQSTPELNANYTTEDCKNVSASAVNTEVGQKNARHINF